MTDDDVEKIIKRNMNLQMNLAGIRADFEEVQQRTWVGLTEQEAAECWSTSTVRTWRAIEAKLKDKNT
jgi:hypothetical protein